MEQGTSNEKFSDRTSSVANLRRGAILNLDGDMDGARHEYEKVLASEPDNVTAINNLGFIQAQEKDFASAIQLYKRALVMAPEYVTAILIWPTPMRHWAVLMKRFLYKKAIRIEPNYSLAMDILVKL